MRVADPLTPVGLLDCMTYLREREREGKKGKCHVRDYDDVNFHFNDIISGDVFAYISRMESRVLPFN